MSSSIACPHCHRKLKLSDASAAGKRVQCPKCRRAFVVKKPPPDGEFGDLADVELDEFADQPRMSPRRSSKGRSTRRKKTPAAAPVWTKPAILGGIAAAILLVAGVAVWLTRSGAPPPQAATATSDTPSPQASAAPDAPATQAAATEPTGVNRDRQFPEDQADRRFPSFPDAVTTPPHWLIADAPFDVEEFFAAPVWEENAAPLYLDALFEFGEYVEVCFPASERNARGPVVRERRARFYAVHQAWSENADSVSARQLDELLAEFEIGFQKLAAAQERPRCVFQTGTSVASLLPHAQTAREVARVIQLRVDRALRRGEIDPAIEDVQALLRLSRDLRPRGYVICQLVSIAVDSICFGQIVPQVLAAPQISTEQCDRLLQGLVGHESVAVDLFSEGVRGDYVILRTERHRMRSGYYTPQRLKEEFGVDSMGSMGEFLVDVAQGAIPPGRGQTLETELNRMTDNDFAREIEAANAWYESVVAAADRPYRELRAALDQAAQTASSVSWFLRLMLPAATLTQEAAVRHETRLNGAKCLAALRRWQLAGEGKPTDLAAIVKAAGLQEVPTDPYTNQPLKLAEVAGQPVVYSIGPDGVDDKGRVEWDFNPDNPGDIVFRFPAP